MSYSPSIYGSLTRNLFKVWNERAELPNKQLVRSLPYVFHDMDVYPSRSQIHEMIHCANDCSRRKNGDYLTFGEFCVYASELKTNYEKPSHPNPLSRCDIPEHRKLTLNQQKESTQSSDGPSKFEVFLGGSCNPTTWRIDIAIPILKSLGITYYNPQVSHWRPELIELEWSAKENAEVLFFVIDNQTRAIVAMIEAAFIAGAQKKLILVFNECAGPGMFIHGEAISEIEYKHLKQSQSYLQDLVERQGIPIFDQVPVALTCVARILHEGIRPQDLSREDNATPVRTAHIQLGDKLIRLREVFDSLDSEKSGEICLTDLRLAFRILTGRELSNNNLRQIAIGQIGEPVGNESDIRTINLDKIRINFDEFCCIITEFKSQISTNEKFGEMLAKKIVFIVEPFVKLYDWLFKPMRSTSSVVTQPIKYDAHYRDIYLGGCTPPSTWKDDIAVPILKKHGLTYYSSQSEGLWSEDRMIPIDAGVIDKSRVLLFVINKNSRGVSTMVLAAHYIGQGCNVVLCIQYLDKNCIIEGEKLTETALKDYNRGRAYLSEYANRAGLPVFDDISEAVMNCVRKCIFNNNITLSKKGVN